MPDSHPDNDPDEIQRMLEAPGPEQVHMALGRQAQAPEDYNPKEGPDDEPDEDDSEFGEPDQGVREVDSSLIAQPMICTLVLTGSQKKRTEDGTGDFADVIKAVINFAEERGLYYFYGTSGNLDPDLVAEGTDLFKAITGRS